MLRAIVKGLANIIVNIFYRIKVTGKENIPTEGAAIICPNHIHAMDSVVAVVQIKRMLYAMAKEELFKGKFKNYFFRELGCFPVKRGKGDLEAVKSAENYLKNGQLLAIYPEGTRNGMKKGIKPKRGAALLATTAEVPIIPLGMKGSFKPFSKVYINFGKPIYYKEYYGRILTKEELDTITTNIMEEIEKLIDK
jgi:1-acyl-sn-glycerol-3-phosphate acyltransferase